MNVKQKAMGAYQTNCYIVTIDNKDIIIDAGIGATQWVIDNVTNPIAILNTHGHFDHIWSNQELKEKLKIPLYTPKGDVFMLSKDPLGQQNPPKSVPDYIVDGDETIIIEGIEIKYRLFAGHTPASSVIEIKDCWFSGDLIFSGSIGRWDFPFSNGQDMIDSLFKAMTIREDYRVYTGHGEPTRLKTEQGYFPYWIGKIQATL